MKSIVIRGIRRIKKHYFIKKFCYFGMSSGIGRNGTGKGCKLNGADHISVGEECFFGEGTELTALSNHFSQELQPNLTIGNHVRCVGGCRITCAGNIDIADNVLIGPGAFITDYNHGTDPDYPGGYSKQPLLIKNIKIGEGVWIGQYVCVMPGANIGDHSIIGAGSIVTHDIPPYSIAVGSPAKVVKKWNIGEKRWVPVTHSFIERLEKSVI